MASVADVQEAIAQAHASAKAMAALPSYKRKAILEHAVTQMHERSEELALALCAEAGKPIKVNKAVPLRRLQLFPARLPFLDV